MPKIEKLKLIEGNFLHEEAREILTSIYDAKINYHQTKNFSSRERVGKDDETAMKRIPALKKEMVKLEKILATAKQEDKKLVISSEINITLCNQ